MNQQQKRKNKKATKLKEMSKAFSEAFNAVSPEKHVYDLITGKNKK